MKPLIRNPALLALALAAPLLGPNTVQGQEPGDIRAEMMRHFQASMGKIMALAEAMPPETYTWSPGEGVMEVGQVYMHIARYNYLYPTQNLGMPLPAGIDMESMEAIRDKDRILEALERSRDWVQETVAGMTAEELSRATRLYGRDVPGWAVLVQLVAHMNEHVGQSIAYARMNGVVPPWSR